MKMIDPCSCKNKIWTAGWCHSLQYAHQDNKHQFCITWQQHNVQATQAKLTELGPLATAQVNLCLLQGIKGLKCKHSSEHWRMVPQHVTSGRLLPNLIRFLPFGVKVELNRHKDFNIGKVHTSSLSSLSTASCMSTRLFCCILILSAPLSPSLAPLTPSDFSE